MGGKGGAGAIPSAQRNPRPGKGPELNAASEEKKGGDYPNFGPRPPPQEGEFSDGR